MGHPPVCGGEERRARRSCCPTLNVRRGGRLGWGTSFFSRAENRKAKAGPRSTQIVRHGRTIFAGPPTHRRKNRRWMGHPIFCWVERGALGSGSPRSPNARDLGHPFFCDGARLPTHRAMKPHDGWGLPGKTKLLYLSIMSCPFRGRDSGAVSYQLSAFSFDPIWRGESTRG